MYKRDLHNYKREVRTALCDLGYAKYVKKGLCVWTPPCQEEVWSGISCDHIRTTVACRCDMIARSCTAQLSLVAVECYLSLSSF